MIEPHGKKLVDLLVFDEEIDEANHLSINWPSWTLTVEQLLDLELLLTGAYSPLTGYMNEEQYESVLQKRRLPDGTFWPVPIVLDVQESTASGLQPGSKLSLRDNEGFMLAYVDVDSVWKVEREREIESYRNESLFSASDRYKKEGPGNHLYVGGKIHGIRTPIHYDYQSYRLSPPELRAFFRRMGWRRISAYQAFRPMHRGDVELVLRAARDHETNILLQPVIGSPQKHLLDKYTRMRCYQAVLPKLPQGMATLSILPLPFRALLPAELLLQAIIHKNYGCSHFIINLAELRRIYQVKESSHTLKSKLMKVIEKYQKEIGVEFVLFEEMRYLPDEDLFLPTNEIEQETTSLTISETELMERIANGRDIPKWFSYPEVLREIKRSHPPMNRQGFTVFFTGLSGAGKSTLAQALHVKLNQLGDRPVTLLDGDIVRKNLSNELGFSREHRDINIRRIGFVASEITKNHGVAICAPIAPYDNIRKEVRRKIEDYGGFVLVHVSTPLEICEKRDRKGLYAKARKGVIKEFTGISDPYEPPDDADLTIDTTHITQAEGVQRILLHLEKKGYLDSQIRENGD